MYRILADGQLFCSSKIEELAVINPVIDLEMNKAGTFKFLIPPTHPRYNAIELKSTIIDVYRDDDTEPLFEGVCVSTEVDFWKQKTVVCEGELTFLNDSTLRPSYQQGKTSRQLLETYIAQHNALTESAKHFTVGQVTAHDSNDSITCFTNYQSTMTEIKEDLVDDIGGFLRVRHVNGVRTLDYLADSPRTSNQVIRLGENLLDLTQSLDTEDLATVIIPLGAIQDTQSIPNLDERLTIKTAAVDSMHPANTDYVYSSEAVALYGWIEKVVEWDDVTVVSNLLAKGKKYLQEEQWGNLIITASAIDLGLTTSEFNKFKLLDSIRVVSAPHGLDRYFTLSKMTINLNNPENDVITLGIEQKDKTLSAKAKSANEEIIREIEKLPTSNMVQSAIDNATALLTGAEGGYVVITRNAQGQPTEIKIQDALNNPTKIWRWNQNGFGYSSDGGQTYGTAITMNGAIVADYITSGTMTADRIRGGTLEVGGTGLGTNGKITIKNISGTVIGSWDKDGIVAEKGTIGGFNIYANYLNCYDNTSYNDSLKSMELRKYYGDGLLLGVWDRDATSDPWETRIAMYYDGNSYFKNKSSGNYMEIDGCIIRGGNSTGEAELDFGAYINESGTTYQAVQLSSEKNFILNTETAYVGTHIKNPDGTWVIWRTETNSKLFKLPTGINTSTGTITHYEDGCIFIHGMLLSRG